MTRDELDNLVDELGLEDILVADGFDDCIIGLAERQGDWFVVYDEDKIIDALIAQGMTSDEAIDHFGFNIAAAYLGENTPAYAITQNE